MSHNPIKNYAVLIEKYTVQSQLLKRKSGWIAVARLITILLVLLLGIIAVQSNNIFFGCIAGIGLVGFVVLMRWHFRVTKQLNFNRHLLQINTDEIAFLTENKQPFSTGEQFQIDNHPYSYDLDVLGNHSIYQFLNRTQTILGGRQLANLLMNRLDKEQLIYNQELIQELTPLLDWRQLFSAHGKSTQDSENIVNKLFNWTTQPVVISKFIALLKWILPLAGITLVTLFAVTFNILFLHFATTVFIFNLITLASQLKQIQQEIGQIDKIHATILGYSELLKAIEEHNWTSKLGKEYQSQLKNNNSSIHQKVNQLSKVFASLESIQNGFGALLFNGTVLYHVHALHRLQHWKAQHASELQEALLLIGKFEAALSFANFSYNNPSYCYPTLTTNQPISFQDLGHPMIRSEQRVCNSVHFNNQSYIILTGSNMSGKSTFLRTLGINYVLANAGAPICASSATIHPLDILVSMRLSDSLSDSESYFFAEVKRLKTIVEALENTSCFVLLDEILRGTNSDDKRNGTVEVIRKMVNKSAIGAIATHDLEVCNTTSEYPNQLANYCFEVEIENNELVFDYKLREGICKNKSATFLMKKMGVI